MKHKVKVTVIDKKLYPELQREYCAVPDSGKCPCYNVGDEFVFIRDETRDDYWHCGAGTLVRSGEPDEGCLQSPGTKHCGSDGVPITQSGYGKTYGNLVVKASNRNPKSVVGPGHNSVFADANGDWWLYYHAFTSLDEFRTRHLFMDKLLWDKNGFPYVENKTPTFQTPREGPKLNLPAGE